MTCHRTRRTETYGIAVEYDEFADDRLSTSIMKAEGAVDTLVQKLVAAPM
jgi:FMN-dependent NADH-azoreductase